MTRVRKEQKTTVQNEAEVKKGRGKNGGGRGHGRGCGRGRGSTQVLKTAAEYEAEADHDSEKQPSKSDLNVISISDDELEPAFDDTPNDLSISGPFKLDYSTIADNSKKICEDDREIETESATASRSAKSMNKKRVLSISSTKNKRQRSQENITDLLEVSESDDDKEDRGDSDESAGSLDEKYSERWRNQQDLTLHDTRKDKPKALNGMKNILEVCQWLIERPDVLVMANQMYNAMNTSLDLHLVNNMMIPTAPISKATAAISANEEKALARLWHEEIKCLFLRCRAPPDDAIESLVKTIFNYDLYSNNAEEVICHSKRTLTDFRSKLNKKIDAKVHEFREIRVKKGKTTAPARSEIEEFMTSEVVEQILYRYLTGTDKTKLKKCGTLERLVLFVREEFKIHYTKYDVKAIKELDNITKNYKVPSRSGKNIAMKLSLEY
ncbi:hypothetical protein GLOIN_2v1771701 [Rhizophagus irregularis DAOM 181602=DAOM 197198]|uniref:Uncharacterized protein n=1 Tax=Rhizophagus irregularis (strain DAOM 181602 / DAOM 197198 / MUCL 43194) TaxID=747089 RepID=A0A2P4Q8Y2_RHIID|nr:hypothetical protein GLOIN_2v1771701 [Rhizophagus irregularis DAOM 181602=DAOM 197198]POG74086.1 hypothetical protein GLOIN_2v1771701 [Rhizophagus irregularis DAOM 181602=DAOM 197198]|eukprot:XP_025180952.1 hypothetical protein GLOIN_2v1771701 [Rhizophagus irregularis DAOM 181602=DAOM 197198]